MKLLIIRTERDNNMKKADEIAQKINKILVSNKLNYVEIFGILEIVKLHVNYEYYKMFKREK